MQRVTLEVVEHSYISTWKVHRLPCLELKKIMDKVTERFTAIDSARPRCKQGIQSLCTLHCSMEKGTRLLQHCSESSKLYLAISGERIILRCERIRNSLESCLNQLKNNVESTLAAKISRIIDYMRTIAFTLDSSEDEAGKVLLALLHWDITASSSANLDEIKAFKFAAFRLQITSSEAVMTEKRSIRKFLSKIHDTNPAIRTAKRKILNYFLYLMRKYGKSIQEQKTERIGNELSGEREGDDDVFDSDSLELPMKFKTDRLNKLMSSCSDSSFNSSLRGLRLQVDKVSFRSSDTNSTGFVTEAEIEDGFGHVQEIFWNFKCSSSSMDNGTNLFILGNLSVLPWESKRKAVEDVKNELKDDEGCCFSVSTTYIKPVFKFLKEAHQLGDSRAKRHGAELLLMFLKACRTEVQPLPKKAMDDLFLFLDSEITEEALSILEILSSQQHYTSEIVPSGILSFILQILKNPKSKHQNLVLRILCDLSAHPILAHHMIYLDCIHHLVPFLDELMMSGYCLKILKNLCTIEESVTQFVENENSIVSIGELLELVKDEELELALDILLDLCYKREEVRDVLRQGSIVSSLETISQNGSSRGKLVSVELHQLLNNITDDERSREFSVPSCESRAKNSCSKSLGFIGKIKSRLRKRAR